MGKRIALGLLFCGSIWAMQRAAPPPFDENYSNAVLRDPLQDYYDDQQALLERVRRQIICHKARSASMVCCGSYICCGAWGMIQQVLGYDPHAAFITALTAICGSVTFDSAADSLEDSGFRMTFNDLCAFKRQIKDRMRIIRTMIADHEAAVRQARSLPAPVLRHRSVVPHESE